VILETYNKKQIGGHANKCCHL